MQQPVFVQQSGTDDPARNYAAVSAQRNRWSVLFLCCAAFLHLRNEIRTFSLSRISQAWETGEPFQVPDDFDFHRLAGSHFGVHWGKGETMVRVRSLSSVADYIRERRWPARR